MTKALLFSGSHSRHLYIHKSIIEIFEDYKIIIMEREEVTPAIPENIEEIDKENFRLHFHKRKIIEKELFGEINPKDVFSSNKIIFIKPNELNGIKVINLIKEFSPDLAFIFGTNLISQNIIDILPKIKINLHLGLSPWYKGSATLFWPFYFLEPQYAGITLHQIEKKADAGEILHQSTPKLYKEDGIHDVGARCVLNSLTAIKVLLKMMIKNPDIRGMKQNKTGRLWLTSDFNPIHLRVIYNTFNDDIVKHYLEGRLSKRNPTLFSVIK